MARKRRTMRDQLGTPTGFTLYRTPERWRWAGFFDRGGILDGGLTEPVTSADSSRVQVEVQRRIEEILRCELRLRWRAADEPDSWVAEVVGVKWVSTDGMSAPSKSSHD